MTGGGARALLVAGLGFGDEGKGTTIDWLARRAPTALVVRYNGGAQAAHNVVDAGGDSLARERAGRHHTFAQLGSATFSGVPTLLSRHVLVNPFALFSEARHLEAIGVARPLSRVFVERGALVTTPYHVAMNRLREMARGGGRHGSCGMGIGETRLDALGDPDGALRAGDLLDPAATERKLLCVREAKRDEARTLALAATALAAASASSESAASTPGAPPTASIAAAAARELSVIEDPSTVARCLDAYRAFASQPDGASIVPGDWLAAALARASERRAQILFEGAQGVLLDQDFGFQPHTTWTDITFANATELLGGAGFDGEITRVGVLRAYATRHGAGPFVTEDPALDRLSAHDHNAAGAWQGRFRSGAADLVAARYALDVLGGADALVVTNVDRLLACEGAGVPVAVAYEGPADGVFFEGARRRIERIRVRRPAELGHQAALARALLDVRPVLERVDVGAPRGLVAYAEHLAARLGLPLAALSFGPTAADKLPLGAWAPRPSRSSARGGLARGALR
jgi:adenylosuccinate synthase